MKRTKSSMEMIFLTLVCVLGGRTTHTVISHWHPTMTGPQRPIETSFMTGNSVANLATLSPDLVAFQTLLATFRGLWETEAMSVTGVLGDSVTITCSHMNAFSNVKYFCKGACKNEEILISSRAKKKDSNKKYSISDDGNAFSVTISHLTEEDSGTYWCGIERLGVDTYNTVILSVIEGKVKVPDSDLKRSEQSFPNEAINTNASSSKKLVYIGAGLGVVVLALAMVLLIFFRHRTRGKRTSSGAVCDTVYAMPLSPKQDSHHITSIANEDDETEGRTSTTDQDQGNIYSNITVSSESESQPDSLFYSTITCNKHTDCSSVSPHTAEVTYSTIKSTSAEELAVYCNV